jgi:hypothetical protein
MKWGSPQEDVVIRALRFLEGFLQRDALQKAAFLKDLEGLWSRCDSRVLRYRVLPPLLGEARNEQLQPIVLPLIMHIVHKQDSQVCHPLAGMIPMAYASLNYSFRLGCLEPKESHRIQTTLHVATSITRHLNEGGVKPTMLKFCRCMSDFHVDRESLES